MAAADARVDTVAMCFGPKKPAAPPPVKGDPELARQVEEERKLRQGDRAASKEARAADIIARLQGRSGRSSLFSGGAGGSGFATPVLRSLFERR